MLRKVRVAIETLGCKLNQAESESLSRQFASAGCEIVDADEQADVYVLNTCTVTHIADRKCRHSLHAAHRLSPHALVVATGCYVDRSAVEIKAVEGVDLVVPNEKKLKLIDIVGQRITLEKGLQGLDSGTRTRAFIKAQDGCNRHCAYCIVPLVRGPEKSLLAGEVISGIAARVAEGYKEVVLTGTEIGSYSSDGLDIKGLLEHILAETKIKRMRISSLQPYTITSELLALWKNPRLCPQFHISLQSGSDSVLKRMKRGYSTSSYEETVSKIRERMPEASITTDIIVGFPGETDAEFQETVDFCRRMGFARIHVFPFSSRPGTVAATMPGQIDVRIKKERSARMLTLAKESARDFISRFWGWTTDVLWENKLEAGVWSGYSSNYVRVYTRTERDLTNVLTKTRLERLHIDGVWGELSSQNETKNSANKRC